MRSLLNVSIETARQGTEVGNSEYRRIDQVVSILEEYKVVVGALQEMKWLGSKVYMVGDNVVLTAGRDVPGLGHVKERGEIAGQIILTGPAIGAWKAGCKCWKAWNSRIVSTILVSGSHSQDHIYVLSCYAPTYASSREEKEEFFDSLPQAISTVPRGESCVMLGDFMLELDQGWMKMSGGM